ncbi:hypothetical protein AB0C59_14240 [Streptomyces sp. NPDC048664]|uniref:hypothetical protein n=1 Tax=Streptomyces sp. NPDC048664 TaxID=3154505 RepID=UPI00344298A0
MTTIRSTAIRRAALPLAALAVLAAGCGTQRAGDDAGAPAPSRSGTATAGVPGIPKDFTCPGESPSPAAPTTPGTSAPASPPADHYAENHGFRVPLPLHGQSRCDGLAASARIARALEPLRRHGDFRAPSTLAALVRLGYPAEKVRSSQSGPTGVSFLVDASSTMCLEGTLDRAAVQADAFAGYPDHSGCDVPSGGH